MKCLTAVGCSLWSGNVPEAYTMIYEVITSAVHEAQSRVADAERINKERKRIDWRDVCWWRSHLYTYRNIIAYAICLYSIVAKHLSYMSLDTWYYSILYRLTFCTFFAHFLAHFLHISLHIAKCAFFEPIFRVNI